VLRRLRSRKEWQLFAALARANPLLSFLWWTAIIVPGVLGALFGVAMGALVSAVQHGQALFWPLAFVGAVFLLIQTTSLLRQAISSNLGDRTADRLYDRLTRTCAAPPGIGHLEDPTLASDLTVAREFDLGMTAPPLAVAVEFIGGSLVLTVTGVACAVVLAFYAWWAPILLLGAWLATHWFLRESAVWRDRNTDEVRQAQRHADYLYRLAVDPAAAKEVRLFGLADWVIERFLERRRRLHHLQYEATRLREKPVAWCLLVVFAANIVVFWSLALDAASGALTLGRVVVFAQSALGVSAVAFGGLNWALDGAAAPIAAVRHLETVMPPRGALVRGVTTADDMPVREIRFRDVTFSYPSDSGDGTPFPVLDRLDLTIPAGSSLAIVGQNGAGKTTLAKLLCRLYDPQSGRIEVDGVDLRELSIETWRSRISAVFQDFVRFEWPLRDNVAPSGAPDDVVRSALDAAGAANLTSLDTILSRSYADGRELSGGQWQRVALARALCAVSIGARVVLLDEPTAQLDVRGEAEIFERILAATRDCTTILISHRFSTVRHADRICVLEQGRVVEVGTHDELMAARGRYRRMFDLQAQRFIEQDEEGRTYDVLT
jgi:ATP-binding cassette, subfamily B, bacterial